MLLSEVWDYKTGAPWCTPLCVKSSNPTGKDFTGVEMFVEAKRSSLFQKAYFTMQKSFIEIGTRLQDEHVVTSTLWWVCIKFLGV
jgi:hypothetical protein